ncbi:hypothetical protein EIN43_19850 [Enterobacter hormaechei]|uniref:50S ribosomal protein L14 n=1 Tax=Enterobacter hormaechei TaxID=158836 RepID=A0A4Y5ZPA9_9ENTR|nr:hypothetical protein EIN43_19850 [Enterobacter hormaechei]
MIQEQTMLNVADNSGARRVMYQGSGWLAPSLRRRRRHHQDHHQGSNSTW